MICSRTKLDSELDRIKQLLIDNGYPEDILLSCIMEKLANIWSEKQFGPEKCPVYLKLPWSGNISSKFENQINSSTSSCFYAVKPVWFTILGSCYHLLKKIAFLPLKNVQFMNFRADMELSK